MKKPSPSAIRSAQPLSMLSTRGPDPLACCNLCGEPSDALRAWREHDEHDRPLPGVSALVFVAADHPACARRLDEHPRLYSEERGDPGHFPGLCGPCVHRCELACGHKSLKANGGDGLKVTLSRFANAIICKRGSGCSTPLPVAVECEGRELTGAQPAGATT